VLEYLIDERWRAISNYNLQALFFVSK